MARGLPHVWGLLVGGPSIAIGLSLSFGQSGLPTLLGVPFVVIGAFTILIGVYISRVAPAAIDFEPPERLLVRFAPSQIAAKAQIGVGVGFLFLTLYLLFGTLVPYVYPTLAFAGFVGVTLRGLVRYWRNSLTTYYVTNRRVMSEYRFLSLQRKAINVENISATGRHQSLLESLVGLGTIGVSAGGGNPEITEIRFRDIDQPGQAESTIDDLHRGGSASVAGGDGAHG